jgi:hypothetical protein
MCADNLLTLTVRRPGSTWLHAEFDSSGWARRLARAQGRHAAWIRADHQGRGHAAFRKPVVFR